DRVLLVVENGVEAFVQVRDVVSPVEVVIDKHLPVAVDVVSAALEQMKIADAKRGHPFHEASQEFPQRSRVWIEVHEHKAFPGLDTDRQQSVLRPIEVFNALELRHAL